MEKFKMMMELLGKMYGELGDKGIVVKVTIWASPELVYLRENTEISLGDYHQKLWFRVFYNSLLDGRIIHLVLHRIILLDVF